MPNVTHLLDAASVRCKADAHSRKRAIELAAELTASSGAPILPSDTVFDELMERERLGSTGLGDGVAIPHCRMNCHSMRVACFTLQSPIDFEAIDGNEVDILFVIVVPKEENEAHLKALATLSEIFGVPDNRDALRACNSDEELLTCIQHLGGGGQATQTA